MGVMSEVATTIAENTVSSKKLRLKILAKKPVDGASEFSQAPEVNCPSTDGRSKALNKCALGTKHVIGGLEKSSGTQNQMNKKLDSIVGCKRKSEEFLECHERKRFKMDHLATANCQEILKKLMNHDLGKLFCAPVDAVAWGIDDYFDIIKKPMDLGTINQKLQQKKYSGIEEFEADVRLTFSNAMLYNPPANWVHKSADQLNVLFDKLWKSVKMRMCREQKDIKQHKDLKQRGPGSNQDKITYDVKPKCLVSISSDISQLPQKAMPQKEKGSHQDLKKQSVERKRLGDLKVLKPLDGKPKDFLSSVDKGHAFASFPATTGSLGATTKGLETVLDVGLSPLKALHVAKLKSRFADIILKAQNHTLMEQSGETNAENWQQEKMILERRQQEEKAKIEAQIRAAESAALLKAESERKRQRQLAREAARMALAEVKRSVDFVDNLQVLKDLEAIMGSSLVVMCSGCRSHATMWSRMETEKLRSPLERLGLYIKEEYMVGNDDDYCDWEGGEVLSC